MLFALDGKTPQIHPTAFVAPGAVLIGDVVLEANASVWFGAVLRGDSGRLTVGEGSNVQDGSVLHEGVTIGKRCVLGHQVLVHETTLGDGVLIGNGAKVMAATVGDGAILAAGAVVKQRGEVQERHRAMIAGTAQTYIDRRGLYLNRLEPVDAEALAFLQRKG